MMIQLTGGSGFVGKNLTHYFRQKGIKTENINLREKNWLDTVSSDCLAIIHLAGKAHDTSNTIQEEEYFRVNRDLTIQIFNKFLSTDIRDFFYFSSVKAVADTVDGVLDENIIGSPVTAYGKSKLDAEKYLLGQNLPAGKRLFIIRPCMVHGAGNKGNLNLLYNVVKKGIPWPLASFDNQRSFLNIDNLAYLVDQMLLDNKVESGIYNFADDEPISTNELVQLMSNAIGKKEKVWHINRSLVSFFVKAGDLFNLPLNSERLKKLTESYVVSNNKIKKALGINQLPTSVGDGIIKTIRSFTS